jgi:hypothetical protein
MKEAKTAKELIAEAEKVAQAKPKSIPEVKKTTTTKKKEEVK